MSEFTPGKWWVAPPIFDGEMIFAPAQEKGRRNEVVAMGIMNRNDARLIAEAKNMYEALCKVYNVFPRDEDIMDTIKELIYHIDGTEGSHE